MYSLNDFKNKIAREAQIEWKKEVSLQFLWSFDLKSDVKGLWMYLADTSRFNRDLGLTPRKQKEVGGQMQVTTTLMGLQQAWTEQPWIWLDGQTICAERIYSQGIALISQAVFHIERDSETQTTKVYVYFGYQPRNKFWKWFLIATESILKNKFNAVLQKIDMFLLDDKNIKLNNALIKPASTLSEAQLARLSEARRALEKRDLNLEVVQKLCDFVEKADDLDAETIRVRKLAQIWGVKFRDVPETCLHASRVGLLNISWNVMCPHCRGARFSANSLGEIPESVHCEICEIEFTSDEKDSVEVVFRTHPGIRKIEEVMYCASEPAKKIHIKIQHKVEAFKTLQIKLPQTVGFYRVRYLGSTLKININLSEEFKSQIVDPSKRLDEEVFQLGFNSRWICENKTAKDLVFILEELKTNDLALRPAEVFLFPDFQDLFAKEHLNSAVKLNLGEQAVLFTDIVGSTKFYEAAGDALAFSQVRTHFQEVFREVRRQDGVVIKTIGDAVMAAFPNIKDAFKAAVEIQKVFPDGRSDVSIRLRASIHSGPVIGVSLNTGIDYFGNTVNMGAKIQACARAGEIAITDEVFKQLNQQLGVVIPFQTYQLNHVRDVTKPIPITVVKINSQKTLLAS
jgi:class 3 adenylate cyclase